MGTFNKRLRIALIALWVLLIAVAFNVIGQGINTLDRLALVETERDRWQRAPEIMQNLNLHEGNTVVDFGCGAGYFAMKLSTVVGPHGTVYAEDILKLPLAFLWIRALRQGAGNIRVIHGNSDDPQIPGSADAVLMVNTYHELTEPATILASLHRALKAGGHLVIADRGPLAMNADHAVDPGVVEAELLRDSFRIVGRQDHFLDQPDDGPWWMIVARKAAL